jgi:hypothetical protein
LKKIQSKETELSENDDSTRPLSLESIQISNTLRHKFIPNECKSSNYQRFGGYKLIKTKKTVLSNSQIETSINSILLKKLKTEITLMLFKNNIKFRLIDIF